LTVKAVPQVWQMGKGGSLSGRQETMGDSGMTNAESVKNSLLFPVQLWICPAEDDVSFDFL